MLRIGQIEIYLINDCSIMVDPGGAFGLVPRVLWQRYFKPSEDQLIPMVQTCLLVRAGDKTIVVDTGTGTKLNEKVRRRMQMRGEGGLLRGLEQLGVAPEAVDMVIDTHLHSDHAGGNTVWLDEVAGTVQPTFPNAEYVVQRREYEDAMQPNERTRATYFPINYQPLVASGQMRLLDGDSELAPGVYGVVTPGHTPGHMSVRFKSDDQHALFVCDLASYVVHFERLGWMTAYDVEPLRTLETKRQWQNWALEHAATLIFPHDPFRPVGQLTQDDKGHTIVQPVDETFVNAED